MINDAETTSRKLTSEKSFIDKKILKMQEKKYLLLSVLLIIAAAFAAYTYLFIQKI